MINESDWIFITISDKSYIYKLINMAFDYKDSLPDRSWIISSYFILIDLDKTLLL